MEKKIYILTESSNSPVEVVKSNKQWLRAFLCLWLSASLIPEPAELL